MWVIYANRVGHPRVQSLAVCQTTETDSTRHLGCGVGIGVNVNIGMGYNAVGVDVVAGHIEMLRLYVWQTDRAAPPAPPRWTAVTHHRRPSTARICN